MLRAVSGLLLLEVLIVSAGWCADPIRVRERVDVSHLKVMLSDLLPAYTPERVRAGIPTVELCDAPQPGGLHLLRREQIVDRMSRSGATLDGFIIPETVLVRNPGVPISEAMVRNAVSAFLSRKGWVGSLPKKALIVFPQVVTAGSSGVELEVNDTGWDLRQGAVDICLRCSNRSCGKFLAFLYLPDSLPQVVRSALLRTMLSTPLLPERGVASPSVVLVTRGKAATLILQGRMLQVSLPVVCLQAGGLNEEVQVFDKQSRQVFEAEVIGRNLVRASL